MRRKPSGVSRALFRLPIWLYRMRLGWLLTQRMLHLTHTGRKSGLPREVVLEVVRYWAVTNTYVVASAWGGRADWYQNIQQTPKVWIKVGRLSSAAIAKPLSGEEAERAFLEYAAEHPFALRYLSQFIGYESPRTEDDVRRIGRQLPMVGLEPLESHSQKVLD